MIRTFRFSSQLALGFLVCAGGIFAGTRAHAAEATADNAAATLQSRLVAVLGRPGGLTSNTVAERAAATSFDVQARHEEWVAAAAGVDQALVGYFPKLSLLARYTRLSPLDQSSLGRLVVDTGTGPATPNAPPNPADLRSANFSFPVLLNQTILQASLNVPLSDYVLRIPQGYAAATRNQKAAALTEQATKLKTASDSRATYYSWVRAKLQQIVAEQALEQAKAHLVDARHAFDAGTISRADVLRIESQVATTQLLLERANNFASISEEQIRVAMHDAANARYEVGENIDADPESAGPPENAATLLTEAKTHRLEVRALGESAESLREQAKVSRAGNLPRLDAFADVAYANPNQRIVPQQNAFSATWDVGVQLTWSPNDIGGTSAQTRTFEARASSLVAQRAALEDAIRLELMQAVNGVAEARASLLSSAQGLAAAEESYRVRRSLFQNGRATSVELTDAETDLTRARLEAINARVDLRIALVRREHALGRDVK